MAPATKTRREKASTTTARRIITRSVYKKEHLLMTTQEKSSKIVDFDDGPTTAATTTTTTATATTPNKRIVANIDEGCSTPKSEKYKIPEIMTCPPAPKKPRVSPSNKSNWFVQSRRPISFFIHPDLDKFFIFAMRDHIKV